jgi:invasion protein IalB
MNSGGTIPWKSRIVHRIGKIVSPDEEGLNEQYLPSTQKETIQSWQSICKLKKDTDSMVAKQILCKTRVCVILINISPNKEFSLQLPGPVSKSIL